MKKLLFLAIIFALVVIFILTRPHSKIPKSQQWSFQSIDTMKYSRDLAREKLHDKAFDKVIDQQIANIAETGATHVAIATPYDSEFLPILHRWVKAARKHKLHVWFRGNWSGWEQWFGYEKIDKETHTAKTKQFILENKDLFENGDIFTSCPECENGAKPNLGNKSEVQAYRKFLLNEYGVTKDAFGKIHKSVKANYYSMNGNLASTLMDRDTTQALDGIVVIDHYVASPKTLVFDVKALAQRSSGRIVLGEFGAPIPDIHGKMSEGDQRQWIQDTLEELVKIPEVGGVNYWVGSGGSTSLWHENGLPKPAVSAITAFYSGKVVNGKVIDVQGNPIAHAVVVVDDYETYTGSDGLFHLPYLSEGQQMTVSANWYQVKSLKIESPFKLITIILEKGDNNIVNVIKHLISPNFSSK